MLSFKRLYQSFFFSGSFFIFASNDAAYENNLHQAKAAFCEPFRLLDKTTSFEEQVPSVEDNQVLLTHKRPVTMVLKEPLTLDDQTILQAGTLLVGQVQIKPEEKRVCVVVNVYVVEKTNDTVKMPHASIFDLDWKEGLFDKQIPSNLSQLDDFSLKVNKNRLFYVKINSFKGKAEDTMKHIGHLTHRVADKLQQYKKNTETEAAKKLRDEQSFND